MCVGPGSARQLGQVLLLKNDWQVFYIRCYERITPGNYRCLSRPVYSCIPHIGSSGSIWPDNLGHLIAATSWYVTQNLSSSNLVGARITRRAIPEAHLDA